MSARSFLWLASLFGLIITEVYGISSQDELKVFNDLVERNYNKNVLPRKPDEALLLDFGVTLLHVDLDTKTGVADIFAWEKYQWKDNRLEWDPKRYNGVTMMRIDNNLIWSPYPDWCLYNSLTIESNIMDTAMVVVSSDGTILWIPRSKRKVLCRKQDDSYQCMLRYGSWTRHTGILEPRFYGNMSNVDVSEYNKFMSSSPWEIGENVGQVVHKSYSCCPETYSYVEFNVTVSMREGYSNSGPSVTGNLGSFVAFISFAIMSIIL